MSTTCDDAWKEQAIAEVEERLRFIESFRPFFAPRITIPDVLIAAYKLDIPMTISQRPSPEQAEAIKAELQRGLQTREYGDHDDEDGAE